MLAQICAIALIGGAASLVLSQLKGGLSFGVRIATLTITACILVSAGVSVWHQISSVIEVSEEVGRYADIILRALGVALLGHFCSLVCRELGAESLSGCVELAARAEILLICLPLIKDIMISAIKILEM